MLKMKSSQTFIYAVIAVGNIIFIFGILPELNSSQIGSITTVFNGGQTRPSKRLTSDISLSVTDANRVVAILRKLKGTKTDPDVIFEINSLIPLLMPDNKPDYFSTDKSWDMQDPKWKEHFYPEANYTGEVCDEIYVRPSDRVPAWPYFKLRESCAEENSKIIGKLITILLNFQTYPTDRVNDINVMLTNVQSLYPDIQIIVAVSKEMPIQPKSQNIVILDVTADDKPGSIWNDLLRNVTTKYVFIGKDILDFEEDSRLERLVREMSPLNVNIIGSSIKTVSNGHWTLGCSQIANRNYTLAYQLGYKHSAHDCLYCHSITGPFLSQTKFLKANPFDTKLPEKVLFQDYFFTLLKKKQHVAVCPDSMFGVRDEATQALTKEQWLPLVVKRSLNKVIDSDGNSFVYTCVQSKVSGKTQAGIAIAPCTLQKLADHIKFVMRTCREHNIFCELNAGTTIGAVKFNGVLPWERDADILFLGSNFSALGKLEPIFKKAGYPLKMLYNQGKGGHGYGAYLSHGSGWKLELYGKPWMHSAKLKSQGRSPTTVMFDGEWVEVPNNVGLEIRDRYGPEVYKHIEHPMVLNKNQYSQKTGYMSGYFSECPNRGSPNCLDQYAVDGNLQFNSEPMP